MRRRHLRCAAELHTIPLIRASENDHQQPKQIYISKSKIRVFAFVFLFLIWSIFITICASLNPFRLDWDFGNVGNFGAAFGPLGAAAAVFAGFFAYRAFSETRDENVRLRDRDRLRDEADHIRNAELTFFRLCDLRNSIINGTQFKDDQAHLDEVGTQAFEIIAEEMVNNIRRSINHEKEYFRKYNKFKNYLGHYLRFTYHIIRFVRDNFESDLDQYKYIRLLRAQLSNSEQVIIALNCAYGEGQEKFKPLVEEFGLLHNISQQDREALVLDDIFDERAFGISP